MNEIVKLFDLQQFTQAIYQASIWNHQNEI